MVEDVEKSGSGNVATAAVGVGNIMAEETSSPRRLAGGATAVIAANAKRDRPAGTSWIFPTDSGVSAAAGGTSVVEEGASSLQNQSSLEGRKKDQDFFDQFEEQTGGENFNRDNLVAEAVVQDDDIDNNAALHNNNIDNGSSKEDKEDEDDINDFFDEFEKSTGGENFRKACF